jgi:hypothetical protein
MFDGTASDQSFSGILSALEAFVARLEPAEYLAGDVPIVLRRISRAEKLCATARLLMSRRAAELFATDAEGATTTAKWLAANSGEGVGKARRDLETAKQLASQPELEEALRRGVVSPTQASVLLPALEADPDASSRLIGAAQEDSLNELRQQCERVVAAKRSLEEAELRDARLRERRHLHIGTTQDGAVSIRGELPPVEGAVVKNALEAMKRKIFDEARRAGRRESHEAYMADALVAMCGADRSMTPGIGGPRAEIILHVSAEALRRGELQAGELCEIEGVGPVSLSTVEYLFGNAWGKLIIEKGVDIAAVTHFGRCIPAHLETALSRRDLVCAVPGCGISYGLERDHIIPVAEGGKTELANLVKLCKRHHYLKTHHFWRLTGRPGTWKWVNIDPSQEIVADGDMFDVVRPGEPVAGLARPVLRPRDPVFSDQDPPHGNTIDTTTPACRQQSFACSAMGAIVVVRVSPALLAELHTANRPPGGSGRLPAAAAEMSHPPAGVSVAVCSVPQCPRAIPSSRCGASSYPVRTPVSGVSGSGSSRVSGVSGSGSSRVSGGGRELRVSGGSGSRQVPIDSMIVGTSDQDRPVAPACLGRARRRRRRCRTQRHQTRPTTSPDSPLGPDSSEITGQQRIQHGVTAPPVDLGVRPEQPLSFEPGSPATRCEATLSGSVHSCLRIAHRLLEDADIGVGKRSQQHGSVAQWLP